VVERTEDVIEHKQLGPRMIGCDNGTPGVNIERGYVLVQKGGAWAGKMSIRAVW